MYNSFRRNIFVLVLFAAGVLIAGSCNKQHPFPVYNPVSPTGPAPAWGPDITPQMLAVIETLDSIAPLPVYDLTPEQARKEPGAADAYKKVLMNFGITLPAPKVDTTGKDIPVAGGTIHLRIYTPTSGKSTYPVIVYYHGGGWVIATIDTYNSSAQALAEKTDAVLISVEYRKGPEFKFPTAHNDAFDAYKWALANAAAIKGDTARVALAGESAGGNMAVAVAIMARDSGIHQPAAILSVYPVANKDSTTASKKQYVKAEPLGTPALPWFLMYYLSTPSQVADPRISLVDANLSGLPPTTIIGAEIDPLQTEGKQLADKLSAAGVKVSYKLYMGVTHEFFGMTGVVQEADEAQDFGASQLSAGLK